MFSHIFLAVMFLSAVSGRWRCFDLPDRPPKVTNPGCVVVEPAFPGGPDPHIYYKFNRKTGLCEEHFKACYNFIGKNTFKTKKDCEIWCPVDRILDKCDLKHYGDDAKPCDCTVQECDWKLTHNFFFNRYTGLCEPDQWWYSRFRGCNKPTANSFPSKASCNQSCPKRKGYCYYPAPPSHCNQALLTKPLYYYDPEIGGCKEDWTGCPSATKNRFKSYEECRRCPQKLGR